MSLKHLLAIRTVIFMHVLLVRFPRFLLLLSALAVAFFVAISCPVVHAATDLHVLNSDTTVTGDEVLGDGDFSGGLIWTPHNDYYLDTPALKISLDGDITATFTTNHSFQVLSVNPGGAGGTFINNGNIKVVLPVTGIGIAAYADNCKTVNNGVIDITSSDRLSEALAAGGANAEVVNTGFIYMRQHPAALGNGAFRGIILEGASSTVRNTGTIFVEGPSTWDTAAEPGAGIYAHKTVKLTNTGKILTTGHAYEVRVVNCDMQFVDTYNVSLDGDPAHASIDMYGTSTLDINDAKLTVSEVDGETIWNTDYKLFKDPNNKVTGAFSSVQALNPNMTAVYTPGATHDDDTVKLEYTPPASPANVSAEVAELSIMSSVNVVHNRMASNAMMQSLGQVMFAQADVPVMVADAGSTVSDVGGGLFRSENEATTDVFAMPYGSWSRSTRSPMGYEALVGGLSAGWEWQKDGSVLGVHGGYGRASIAFTGSGYKDNSEVQNMFNLGMHGGTVIGDWVLGMSVTPYLTLHEFEGKTGAALTIDEKADFSSFGTVDRALAGYRMVFGDDVFMPTAGLTHMWIHRDSYTTKANGAWDTSYSTLDDHELQATGGLRWMRNVALDSCTFVPSIYAGVRQTLTDGSTSTTQAVQGAPSASVKSRSDLTVANLEMFASFIKDDWTVQLGYAGETGKTTVEHGAWLRLKWLF